MKLEIIVKSNIYKILITVNLKMEHDNIENEQNQIDDSVNNIVIEILDQLCKSGVIVTSYEHQKVGIVFGLDSINSLKFLSVISNIPYTKDNKKSIDLVDNKTYQCSYINNFKLKIINFLLRTLTDSTCTITCYSKNYHDILEYLKNHNEQNTCDENNWLLV